VAAAWQKCRLWGRHWGGTLLFRGRQSDTWGRHLGAAEGRCWQHGGSIGGTFTVPLEIEACWVIQRFRSHWECPYSPVCMMPAVGWTPHQTPPTPPTHLQHLYHIFWVVYRLTPVVWISLISVVSSNFKHKWCPYLLSTSIDSKQRCNNFKGTNITSDLSFHNSTDRAEHRPSKFMGNRRCWRLQVSRSKSMDCIYEWEVINVWKHFPWYWKFIEVPQKLRSLRVGGRAGAQTVFDRPITRWITVGPPQISPHTPNTGWNITTRGSN
jgi:hypothetical protein